MGENADVAGTAGAAIEEVVRENARRHEARRQSAAREAVAREVEMPGESAHVRRERCRRDFLYWADGAVPPQCAAAAGGGVARTGKGGWQTHPHDYAQGEAVGRVDAGADVYGMDTVHPDGELAFADMRAGGENVGIHPRDVRQYARNLS